MEIGRGLFADDGKEADRSPTDNLRNGKDEKNAKNLVLESQESQEICQLQNRLNIKHRISNFDSIRSRDK